MTPEELARVVQRLRAQKTDDATVEVKSCQRDLGKSVWESVSAFANTVGGTLILGLDENDEFKPVKGFELDRVRDQFHDGVSSEGTSAKVKPAPRYSLDRVEFEGSQVLVISIQESAQKPCYVAAKGLENGSYRRVDDKDVHLSSNDIFEFKNKHTLLGADRKPVTEATLADLEDASLKEFSKIMEKEHPRSVLGAVDFNEKLRRWNVVTSSGAVTVGAVLVLGKYPQQFFPRLTVEVTAYPGNEKADTTKKERFLDREICDGRAPELVESSVVAIRRNLRMVSIVQGTGRVSEPEIPEEVLREAIANAIVHREYDVRFQGEPVAVDIYADRVEIRSPGGLWGSKTLENLADGVTAQRNPTLMAMLSNSPAARDNGFTVEGAGSGIPLMFSKLRELDRGEPRFSVTPSSVKVVLYRHGAEHKANQTWVEELIGRPPSREELIAVLQARESESVTADGMRALLGVDINQIKGLLANLAIEGVLTESKPGVYDFHSSSKLPTPLEMAILRTFSGAQSMGIKDLSEKLGKSPNTLRPRIRALVERGYLEAEGAVTSRSRTYKRPVR